MNLIKIISIIKFLVDNQEQILAFIEEIKRLIDMLTKNGPVIITQKPETEEEISKAAMQLQAFGVTEQLYPAIASAIKSANDQDPATAIDFQGFLELLLQNLDTLKELATIIIELVNALRN